MVLVRMAIHQQFSGFRSATQDWGMSRVLSIISLNRRAIAVMVREAMDLSSRRLSISRCVMYTGIAHVSRVS